MKRWHLIRRGRILASCECKTGDGADVLLPSLTHAKIVSDAEWRAFHFRRALRRPVAQRTMQDVADQLATQQGAYRVV